MGRVCNRTPDLRYYLCMYLVDMRKQFNGLQGIVTQEFGRYIPPMKHLFTSARGGLS